MSEITYDDKVDLQVATNIANINKVTASDMNEIKSVVNGNADEVGDITSLTTTDKTSVVNAVNELNTPEKWVSVGTTAPTDGRRVWFAKGKNLFDIDNAYHGTINGSGVVGPNEGFRTTQNISTQPGKTYYFSTTQKSGTTGNQIYIAYYNSSGTFVSRTSYNALKNAFTTPANCYYMRAGVMTENQENIMLNEGTIELPYEPYVEPSINVDGEELNFDNYSTNEQVIGKWIDGKNIYRKTYQVTNISSSNVDLVDISDLNIDTIVKLYGFIRSNLGMCMPMPLTDSSTNYNVLFLGGSKIRGRVVFGTSGSVRDCYVTIEYTKK